MRKKMSKLARKLNECKRNNSRNGRRLLKESNDEKYVVGWWWKDPTGKSQFDKFPVNSKQEAQEKANELRADPDYSPRQDKIHIMTKSEYDSKLGPGSAHRTLKENYSPKVAKVNDRLKKFITKDAKLSSKSIRDLGGGFAKGVALDTYYPDDVTGIEDNLLSGSIVYVMYSDGEFYDEPAGWVIGVEDPYVQIVEHVSEAEAKEFYDIISPLLKNVDAKLIVNDRDTQRPFTELFEKNLTESDSPRSSFGSHDEEEDFVQEVLRFEEVLERFNGVGVNSDGSVDVDRSDGTIEGFKETFEAASDALSSLLEELDV